MMPVRERVTEQTSNHIWAPADILCARMPAEGTFWTGWLCIISCAFLPPQPQHPVTQVQPDGRTFSWGGSVLQRIRGLGEAEGLQMKEHGTRTLTPKEGIKT